MAVKKKKKQKAIIVDLDGTLADIRVRLKHIEGPRKNWKKFHASIETDELHEWCREIVNRMASDHKVILVSGRVDTLMEDTEAWLEKYGVSWDLLYMRPHNDHRPDTVLKEEIYREHIEDKYEVTFVLEDRAKVVNMWRGLGLICLQVAHGDF